MSVLWSPEIRERNEWLWPNLKVTTAPTSTPVSVSDVKQYCDYDDNDRDGQFLSWLKTATELVEHDTERAFLTQTRTAYMPYFPRVIHLQVAPVTAVSIAYLDVDGASQTLSTSIYQTDLNSTPVRIREDYAQVWPDTECDTENAVTITVTCGYGTADSVPERAKEAIRLVVKRMFDGCWEGLSGDMVYQGLVGGLRWRLT